MTHQTLSPSRRARLIALVTLMSPALVLGSHSDAAAAPDKTVSATSTRTVQIPDRGIADTGSATLTIPQGHGRVTDVDVTLVGLNHRCPEDLDVVVVGPSGQRATLMFDVGACADPSDTTLTFDDEADEQIANDEVPVSGMRYKPTNLFGGTQAPASLQAFDGLAASGAWQLVVVDMSKGDGGTLAGWSIEIDYNDTVAPSGTVSIDGGAAQTNSPTTRLALSAADPDPGTEVTQVRFSNDGTTWSAFRPYAATTTWTLATGDGTKTVYAQFADDFGNLSPAVSDTIVLDTRVPDTTAPTTKRLTPKHKKKNVSVNTKVSFVASERLDAATVTKRTVKLTADGKKVRAMVSYSAAKAKVVLKPAKALTAGTTYKVTISPKVTDLAGNGFSTKPWRFRTR